MSVLRLDLPDPVADGNKSWKLKYHLEAFHDSGAEKLITFGGAFSNHIAATACAGKRHSITTIGVIRGDELRENSNDVLQYAHACGMQLHFVSREEYGMRYDETYHRRLQQQFGNAYVVPEGGAGEKGIRGCMEILNSATSVFDEIVVPVGTGATLAGLLRAAEKHQRVTGIAIGHSSFEKAGLDRAAAEEIRGAVNFDHTLGGYARSSEQLEIFMRVMKNELDLPLDHVYSGKTLFAVHNMAKSGGFSGANLLFIHTGGYAFTGNRGH